MKFFFGYPFSKVITTGPTDRQVREILWSEIAAANRGALIDLGGSLIKQKWEIQRDWFALGFTTSDHDPSAAQGFHAPYVMVVLDEAVGISREVREALSGNLSSGYVAKQVEIGNPTDPQCAFADECASKLTHTIKISAFDTPNFQKFGLTAEDFKEDDPTYYLDKIPPGSQMPAPYLVKPDWVAKQVYKHGWDDPFCVSRIRGEFPTGGPLNLIEKGWILAAQSRSLPEGGAVILSCDVARHGDDYTVIGLRKGHRYRRIAKFRGYPTDFTHDELVEAHKYYGADEIRIDDVGVGGGVTDFLKRRNLPVIPMDAGAASEEIDREEDDEDFKRFGNAKTEWHWHFRDLMRKGLVDLDPHDEDLAADLEQLRKRDKYTAGGKMMVESKEIFKKRVKRSPDDADACIMAFAPVELPQIQVF